MPGTWWDYATCVAGTKVQKDIAALAGVDPSQVSRWSKGRHAGAEAVIHFARATNTSPLVALIKAGWLTRDDVDNEVIEIPLSIQDMPLSELLNLQSDIQAEVMRRYRNAKNKSRINRQAPPV